MLSINSYSTGIILIKAHFVKIIGIDGITSLPFSLNNEGRIFPCIFVYTLETLTSLILLLRGSCNQILHA